MGSTRVKDWRDLLARAILTTVTLEIYLVHVVPQTCMRPVRTCGFSHWFLTILLLSSNRSRLSLRRPGREGAPPRKGRSPTPDCIALLRPLLDSPGGSPLCTAGGSSSRTPEARACPLGARSPAPKEAPGPPRKGLENLATLQGQRKSRNGPVTPQPIPHRGITEPLPRLCEATLTIRLRISNLR